MSNKPVYDPTWVPDWLEGPIENWRTLQHVQQQPAERSADLAIPLRPVLAATPSAASNSDTRQITPSVSAVGKDDNGDGFIRRQKVVIVKPRRDRTVNRKLHGIQLFMITVNATLGTGLYWRGGQILELGGPLAVLLSFLLVGFLAWAVMQCITELLCIWPIPGALSVYVSEFVDAELGIAVGVAYWFTYSVSFAALIATSAAEIDFWASGNKGIDGGIVFLLIPVILVAINAFGIQVYGAFEVFAGTVKILFYFIIVIALIVIAGMNRKGTAGAQYWAEPTSFDDKAAPNWFSAFLMSLSIASFAYVGVEIVAASALEARWPQKEDRIATDLSQRSSEGLLIGKTVKFSAVFISVLATGAYTLGGLLVTFNMPRTDCSLPRLSWTTENKCLSPEEADVVGNTTSAFVAIAQKAAVPHLDHFFNVFLVFTALTCANTNLYVASRSLFGLTSRLDGGPGQPRLLRVLAWFGRTNHRKVPMRALIFSAVAFCWVPFLQLKGGNGDTSNSIGMFIEILAEMGSVGVVIVWACECWAFIRYYHCIERHRAVLEGQRISQVRRWDEQDHRDYPYRSHGQPFLAYLALGGCLFVLVISNGAALWHGFNPMPFLSSYLIVLVFAALLILLKFVRGAKWALVDLDNPTKVVNKIRNLHDIRLAAS